MRHMIGRVVGLLVVGLLGAVALGMLLAAAVVLLAKEIGTAGALGAVGGGVALVALVVLFIIQGRRRAVVRQPPRGTELSAIAGSFLVGVVEGLTRPRRRD
jgi:UDP-N-acetylmuramyl pentapeptide phosphotransferase/UDP-N-acetylglucosamine-1-phosphate transferase